MTPKFKVGDYFYTPVSIEDNPEVHKFQVESIVINSRSVRYFITEQPRPYSDGVIEEDCFLTREEANKHAVQMINDLRDKRIAQLRMQVIQMKDA